MGYIWLNNHHYPSTCVPLTIHGSLFARPPISWHMLRTSLGDKASDGGSSAAGAQGALHGVQSKDLIRTSISLLFSLLSGYSRDSLLSILLLCTAWLHQLISLLSACVYRYTFLSLSLDSISSSLFLSDTSNYCNSHVRWSIIIHATIP